MLQPQSTQVVRITGELPVLQPLHQACTHRVLMNIGHNGYQVPFVIDAPCLCVQLKEAPVPVMAPVNRLCIRTQQYPYTVPYPLSILRLDMHKKVKMRRHQAISDNYQIVPKVMLKLSEKVSIVLQLLEDDLVVVGTIIEVIVLMRKKLHCNPQLTRLTGVHL
jgi:hypothetical protein